MSRIDEIEKRPEFVAYNQAVEDAKEAIRGEHVEDFAAVVCINAIARKCSPHVYVNRLVTSTAGGGQPFKEYLAEQMRDPEFRVVYEQICVEEDAKLAAIRAGGERCAERHCVECGHLRAYFYKGQCVRDVGAGKICMCKCVFPAPPQAEQIKAENCKPAGDCANCGAPIVEAFALGIGDYWYHVRGLAYCDTDNPSFDRTATPKWLAKEEGSNTSTPVPAEAAAHEFISSSDNAFECRDCSKSASDVVHANTAARQVADEYLRWHWYGGDDPYINELNVLTEMIENLQPSTATTSAVVEAAASEIARWMNMIIQLPDFVVQQNAVSIKGILSKHFPPTEAAIPAGEAPSGLNGVPRLSHQEDTLMNKNYDGFRAGMLRAAEIARSEFKRAPEAAKGNDCVWMGGYESACDHLSVVIAQAAVIDSVRIAGAQPDWQYHIALLLPDEGVEDSALLKIYQVVEHEIRTARTNAIDEAIDLAAQHKTIWTTSGRSNSVGAADILIAALAALKQKQT